MKTFAYSSALLLMVAGTTMGKNAEMGPMISSSPTFTTPVENPEGSGDRTGILINVNVAGIQSFAGFGNAGNTFLFFNIGAGNSVNGFGYDVVLSANDPSWRSEITVGITNTTVLNMGLFVRPGFMDQSPGLGTPYTSNGIVKLNTIPIAPITAGADGLIRLQFFETYDDPSVAPDGQWKGGIFTLQVTPTPGAAGLLGLAGVSLLGRKRR